MPKPVLTLTVIKGARTTTVPVTAQASPGPSGYETFAYVDEPPSRQPEIDATALRSLPALQAFLATLVRNDEGETPVWILEPRLTLLRELLGAPPDAGTFTIAV